MTKVNNQKMLPLLLSVSAFSSIIHV
jgi:hypothetical protein